MEEADGVIVLLLVEITLLLTDEVLLTLPDVVGMTKLLDGVEVVELVVVPLAVETEEDDVRTEVDEPAVVIGAVGLNERELLLPLPYGAPLEIVLETIPLEGPVV